MSEKVLVLGGNGFIGSHLADKLVEEGYEVSVFDKFSRSNNLKHKKKIEAVKGEFEKDFDKVIKACEGVDYIFHYLATTNPGSSAKLGALYDVETNLVPTIKVLEHASKNGVKKFIFPSSGGAVYGKVDKVPVSESHGLNPQSPYSVHKAALEKYLYYYHEIFGLDYVVFRIANVYGPRQDPEGTLGFITISLGKIIKGEKPTIFGDGKIVRDYIFIDDIVSANLDAIRKGTKHNIFNLGSGEGYSLNEILKEMSKVLGKDVIAEYTPGRKVDVPEIYLDIGRIKKELDWKPEVSLAEGIKRTYEWLEQVS